MNDTAIARIHAREVLDSRGNPTVEVEVFCRSGASGRAIVPSGASTGKHEAVELRDGDPEHFAGRGVRKAVANVREQIAPALVGRDVTDQAGIDRLLCEIDGTPNKSRLGANAILGVSLATAHAAAAARGLPLWRALDRDGRAKMPLPMVNLISGGLHGNCNLDYQDFLLVPVGASTYSEALEITFEVYRALGQILNSRGFEGHLVADEGGYGPKLFRNADALEAIVEAIRVSGHQPGTDAAIALDIAATHFHDPDAGTYCLRAHVSGEERCLTTPEMVDLLAAGADTFPVVSIEDGIAEDDWAGWKLLTECLGGRVQLIGDDLFVTNPARLREGIERGVANAILIKPNQIGTLTETLDVIAQARAAGYRPVISARSGETEDSTIADLAVATGAGQIKIGSIARGERLAKYNQLLRIEEELPGPEHFARWVGMGKT